jgi:hemerythrin-like metal-binding protein
VKHQELIERVAAANEALRRGEQEAVAPALEFLADRVLGTFEAEEGWMRRIRYPRYDLHVSKHDEFVGRLLSMVSEQESTGATSLLSLRLRMALGWLEDHVEEEDAELGKHLRARAAQAR